MLVRNIYKSHGGKEVLRGVSLQVGQNQKVALVGSNGVGKSTLLKILAGLDKPDAGSIQLNGEQIGYLPQEIKIDSQETIRDYLKRVTGISEMESRMAELEHNLNDPEKMKEYGELQSQYIHLDGYAFEHRMEAILQGFGLSSISVTRSLNSLSGGQKSKIALAGLLLQKFDLLLLDEPTNNLDLPAIIWLENFLQHTDASCLIVSHDRRFLDKLVSKVFEIDWFKRDINEYTGSYSDYLDYREARIRREQEQYQAQEREKKRLMVSIRQKKQWAERGSKQITTDNDKYVRGYRRDQSAKVAQDAKSIERQIEQMDKVEVTKQRPKLVIPLVADNSEAKQAIVIEDVCVQRSNGFQLGPVNMQIGYGARIGIIGPNGSGKSTLLKVISGEYKPTSGRVIVGSSLNFGNLMQAHENMSREKSIFDFFHDNSVTDNEKIYFILSKFHFSADDAKKKIGDLSPGERARVLLALFSALSVNVLVLDEPTNHLDFEVIEALERTLADYPGTVVFVSHDRYFLQMANPTDLFIINDGNIKPVVDYDGYISSLTSEAKKLMASLP
jgi:ATPase subunit of ABC transporter with duplicated ATPase domains